MKRLFSCILAMAILLTLCACDSKTPADSAQSKVELPNNGRTAPSNETIQADIMNALLQKNPIVELTGVETIKSLTEDDSYEITVEITAQSKYADWLYEAKLCYTKYDQGWMLDCVGWASESFERVRTPDIGTMVNYVSVYLPFHEVDNKFDHMLPIQNPTMDFVYDANINAEIINFGWETTYQEMHSEATLLYTSQWEYTALSDSWELVFNNDGYCIDYVFGNRVINSSLDFSGEWHAEKLSPTVTLGGYGTIIISNYSWEGFNAHVPGLDEYYDIDAYFKRTDVNDLGNITFTNSEGHYIEFQPQRESGTRIMLWLNGTNVAIAEAQVNTNLPTIY